MTDKDLVSPADMKYEFPTEFSLTGYFKRAYSYRSFLLYLSFKWIKIKYEESQLGLLWIIVNPILIATIYSVCLGWALNGGKSGPEYFLFVYSGLVAWQFFRDMVLDTADCVLREPNVLKRSNFPRILVPFSVLLPKLAELIVGYLILIIIALLRDGLSIGHIALMPLLIINISLLSLGLGMAGIYVITRFRDIKHFIKFIFPFLLYVVPVLYDHDQVPENFRKVLDWNPLAKLLLIQKDLLFTDNNVLQPIIQLTCISLLIFFAGTLIFIRTEKYLVDYL
jgi:lipopolysaccharide transport system permease protein